MTRFLETLRTGDWLTRERIQLVALATLVASAFGLAYLVLTAHGLNDYQGRPLGTDFSSFYAAGTYAQDGQPTAPFNPVMQHAREQQLFGSVTPFYSWAYPPFFLFIAATLALLSYPLALIVWQGTTLTFYLAMTRAAVASISAAAARDRLWVLLALAYPAVFVNVGHGQNGLLSASLLGGALVLLPKRPILAGILIGFLAYKPQFGLMIPLALLADARWKAIAAAAVMVAMLVLATLAAFGPDAWRAFFVSNEFARTTLLETGDVGWHKMQSVFAWVRMWHGSVPLAYALQGAAALVVAAALAWLWRSDARYLLKAAALAIGTLLATPFSLDYDLMMLAPALAFLTADGVSRGFHPFEKSTLAVLWVVPLIARNLAEVTLIPLAVPAMAVLFALVLRRAFREAAPSGDGILRPAA
jgi:alpha-1,2-mannosyltransferase